MCLEIGETNTFHDACILFGDVSQFNIMSDSLASDSYSRVWHHCPDQLCHFK